MRRAFLLLALLLIAAPAQAQVADTTGIFSDRQLRQRITFQLAQLKNIIAAAEAAQAHAAVTYDHVHRRIVRDSLRAVAPIPADSVRIYLDGVPVGPSARIPTLELAAGEVVRVCALEWAGGRPRIPIDEVEWWTAGDTAALVVHGVSHHCAEATAMQPTTLPAAPPSEYRLALASIRRRSRA
jgi:hypothetical protein